MAKRLSVLTWMMGLLMAPHALALMGNLAGLHQRMFFLFLVAAAGFYWINAQSIRRLNPPATATAAGALRPVLTLLQLSSGWITTMALSTVLLVTAGFSFNETFLRAFPNFAFAFLLLGVVLAIQVLGPRAALKFQYMLVGIVVGGLTTLVIMGLWSASGSTVELVPVQSAVQAHDVFTMLLLFVGFDLAFNQGRKTPIMSMRTMTIGLSALVLAWGLWGWISIRYVPAAKLSDSFIPHIIAARNVGGDFGRIIMGGVIIAGSTAAVNALLTSLSQTTPIALSRWLAGRFKKIHWIRRPVVWSAMGAATIGLMMTGGIAGSDEIDLYVRAGLILWIIYYGAVHLALLVDLKGCYGTAAIREGLLPAMGAATMWLAAGALIFLDPHRIFIMKIISIVAIAGSLLWVFAFKFQPRAGIRPPLGYKTRN